MHPPSPCFQFPKIKFVGISTEDANSPYRLVQKGPEEAKNLRRRLEKYCGIVDQNASSDGISFRWEPHMRESYEVANVIFHEIARANRSLLHQALFSFPSMSNPDDLDKLAAVLQTEKCRHLLGLEEAHAELYPTSPAPYMCIKFSTCVPTSDDDNCDPATLTDSASSATKSWVNNFLGKYRLCPYTSSVSHAAVGLPSVGVPVGGVHVRVSTSESTDTGETKRSYNIQRASGLVHAFWSEVVTLMHSPQEEWATSLVVFPEFDSDFESFVDVCDKILEPAITATQSTTKIGRAWFHPRYDADSVGHSDVIAGHAVPNEMVEGFIKSSLHPPDGKDNQVLLEYDEVIQANNRVRQTPHATINILRRSQLIAAAEYEKGLGDKKPKANSIYVRNTIRLSEVIKRTANML